MMAPRLEVAHRLDRRHTTAELSQFVFENLGAEVALEPWKSSENN
jgi:hypothetical protein